MSNAVFSRYIRDVSMMSVHEGVPDRCSEEQAVRAAFSPYKGTKNVIVTKETLLYLVLSPSKTPIVSAFRLLQQHVCCRNQ